MTVAKRFDGFEERSSEFRGTRLQALVGGPPDGPPLVLLHGLGGSRSNWAFVAPELARTRRVLVVDLPGHGRSTALPAAPGLGPYADRVAKLLEDEGHAPADVVGHSFGGLVGIRLAARRPELVRSLVLAPPRGSRRARVRRSARSRSSGGSSPAARSRRTGGPSPGARR